MNSERRRIKFVRLVAVGAILHEKNESLICVKLGDRAASLELDDVQDLVEAGVLQEKADQIWARPEARSWLKRQVLCASHADRSPVSDNQKDRMVKTDLVDTPLTRLTRATAHKPAFLLPHHIKAAERIQALVERGQLLQRTTMSYDPTRLPGSGSSVASDVSEFSLDARRTLFAILDALPTDCAGVVLDICGFSKGLQVVEHERRWPRRSAKLVLRIGLDQIAQQLSLQEVATGPSTSNRTHLWRQNEAVPTKFG